MYLKKVPGYRKFSKPFIVIIPVGPRQNFFKDLLFAENLVVTV